MWDWKLIIIVIIVYTLIEFIGGILFNWRLFLLSEKKFTLASIFSAASVVILISSFVVSTYIGVEQEKYWIIPVSAVSMGIGNLLAALLVPKIRDFLTKRKDQKIKSKE